MGSCAGLALIVLARCVLREVGDAETRRLAVMRPNGSGLVPPRTLQCTKHGCDAFGVGSHDGVLGVWGP